MGNRPNTNGQKKGKPWLKKTIAWLHLWLGLISGVVVLIVSITGCMFVFHKEIDGWIRHDKFYVEPQQQPVLPASVLWEKAQAALGEEFPMRSMVAFRQPDHAWEGMSYKAGNPDALTFLGSVDYYKTVYINPYDGSITGIVDMKYDFFVWVKYAHWSLLLSTKYGQPIVGWSTLIFVILLITGLVLWWPKKWNKRSREQSFRIKWSGNFKRINYDLHNVLGFYSLLIALVIALTGMVWSFEWMKDGIFLAATGTTKPPEHKKVQSDTLAPPATTDPLDIAYTAALKETPDAKRMMIGAVPAANAGTIRISAYWGKETYYNRDDLQFDKHTGKLLLRETAKGRNAGEKLISMNYDIHVGAIGGLAGKILAFFISLICASLPVTGLLVWLNKGKKKVKKPKPQPVAAWEKVSGNSGGLVSTVNLN